MADEAIAPATHAPQLREDHARNMQGVMMTLCSTHRAFWTHATEILLITTPFQSSHQSRDRGPIVRAVAEWSAPSKRRNEMTTNDAFANHELSIEELEAIAAGSFWSTVENIEIDIIKFFRSTLSHDDLGHLGSRHDRRAWPTRML